MINLCLVTRALVNAAAAARELGVTVVAVTAMRRALLTSRADHRLIVPRRGYSTSSPPSRLSKDSSRD